MTVIGASDNEFGISLAEYQYWQSIIFSVSISITKNSDGKKNPSSEPTRRIFGNTM